MKKTLWIAVLLLIAGTASRAQWTQTAGPEGGNFSSAIVDGDRVIAVGPQGFLYQYKAGEWTRLGQISPVGRITTLLQYGDTLVANATYGIFRSLDRGASWSLTMMDEHTPLLVGDERTLIVATNDTIFASRDRGASWYPIIPDKPYVSDIDINGTRLVINLSAFLLLSYTSSDGGITWNPEDTLWNSNNTSPMQFLGSALVRGDTIYATLFENGIIKSVDRGRNWTPMNEGLPQQNDRVVDLSDLSEIGNDIWGKDAGGRLFRYDGSRWNMENLSMVNSVTGEADGVVALTRSGLYRRQKGEQNWQDLNRGLRAALTGEMLAVADGILVSEVYTGKLFKSGDAGATWRQVANFAADAFAVNGGTIYAIAATSMDFEGRVMRSTDNGESWTRIDEMLPGTVDYISTIVADESTIYIGYSQSFGEHGVSHWTAGGMIRSTDGGETWSQINSGIPYEFSFSHAPIGAILIDGNDIYASTAAGIFRSTNRGGSWKPASTGIPIPQGLQYPSGHAFGAVEGVLFATTYEGLFQSSNRGESWSLVTSVQLDRAKYESISSTSVVDRTIYLTTSTYMSPSEGFRYITYRYENGIWNDISVTLPGGVAFNRFIRGGNHLFGGTSGSSVWSMPVTAPPASAPPEMSQRSLIGIYPNPSTDRASIEFQITTRDHVSIEIINALGETVATLLDREMEIGTHLVPFDNVDLPAGLYIVRLTANGNVESGSIVRQ